MKLTDFELEVMQLFWRCEENTAPEINQMINKSRNVSYSTVKTIIDRLEIKKAIERSSQQGRTIYYRSIVEKNQLRQPMIKDFVNRVFLGKSKPLVSHLIQEENYSLDDIHYLEELLRKRKEELK